MIGKRVQLVARQTNSSNLHQNNNPHQRLPLITSKVQSTKKKSLFDKEKSCTTPKFKTKKEDDFLILRKKNLEEEESLSVKITRLLESPELDENGCGKVNIKFNHYNKSFPIYNGILKWKDIDDEYCFSFVYRGNYTRNIYFKIDHEFNYKEYIKKEEFSDYFIGLVRNEQYYVEVIEDPIAGIGAEGLRLSYKPIFSKNEEDNNIKIGNNATTLLTNDLKALKVCELTSERARDLLERRELEQILYSSN